MMLASSLLGTEMLELRCSVQTRDVAVLAVLFGIDILKTIFIWYKGALHPKEASRSPISIALAIVSLVPLIAI